jgi:hypothetical protein
MIQSVENYYEGAKVFNADTIEFIHEFSHGTKRSTVRKHKTVYVVDLYSQRGIESRTRYDNVNAAKTAAETWVSK